MKAKELAEKLNNCNYREEITIDLVKTAKDNGLVVVFGASDDLMEFCGAIWDEIDAWDGRKVYLNEKLNFKNKPKKNRKLIEAIWCPKDDAGNVYTSWKIESEIPNHSFNVMDDGDLYCIGLVFSTNDINTK